MCKRKLRYHTLWFKSFLPPSLVFYPTFVTSKVEHIWAVNMKSEQTSRLKKWGKKLVRGVKNFWIFSISISAFICTKNYQKIFKTRECTSIRANVYICAKSGKEKSSSFKVNAWVDWRLGIISSSVSSVMIYPPMSPLSHTMWYIHYNVFQKPLRTYIA